MKNKPLRYTKVMIAQRASQRKAMFAVLFYEENTEPPGVAVLNVTKSQQKQKPAKALCPAKRYKWKLQNAEAVEAEILYQEDPSDVCLYTKYTGIRLYSPTNSRQSRQNYAWRNLMILRRKRRIPTFEIRVNFFVQFPTKYDIDELRAKINRCLRYRNIAAIVAIELTCGKDDKPNNTVHFHYLMGDKENDEPPRTDKEAWQRRKEIAGFIQKACERQGLVLEKDFKIDRRGLWDGKKYFAYFVKYGKYGKDIPLFIEGLNMQEITQTGWFERSEQERLWDEYCKERYKENYSRKAKKTKPVKDNTDTE